MNEKGSVSINTENIFPIIKKWLYSEKDIFLRELVSNASDAVSKYKKLMTIGSAPKVDDAFRIDVTLDKINKTIAISDNGIGMTAEEVDKYINQIAFSGAKDFLEKYGDKADDAQIIGHFGLGFYSSFMVSKKVTIDTLSWQEGAKAVYWESEEGTDYEIKEGTRESRGTTVTMYLAEDCEEFLDKYELLSTLKKYFSFLPVEIFLNEINTGEDKKDEEEPINDINPLWIKDPKECTDEEYKEFYKTTFGDFNDPLFWIHLNLDYPFTLKGILYFPKLKHEFETMEGQVKLYYNQVFVADNIKEVIPEFLLLLKGCIDCPDLPLNVSRSFLQNDGSIKALATHITKKVSDKLKELYKKEKENYEKYWDDISPFVKYGCIREEKFYKNVKDIVIFKTINDDYVTLNEYFGELEEDAEKKIYYVENKEAQAQYIQMFKDNGLNAVVFDTMIDNHFKAFLESKDAKLKFVGIDSESDALASENEFSEEESKKIVEFAKKIIGNDKVEVKSLKSEDMPGIIELSEQSRRMAEMAKMYGGMGLPMMELNDEKLILNGSNKLVKGLADVIEKDESRAELIVRHINDLALLSCAKLTPEKMAEFIKRSVDLL